MYIVNIWLMAQLIKAAIIKSDEIESIILLFLFECDDKTWDINKITRLIVKYLIKSFSFTLDIVK